MEEVLAAMTNTEVEILVVVVCLAVKIGVQLNLTCIGCIGGEHGSRSMAWQ